MNAESEEALNWKDVGGLVLFVSFLVMAAIFMGLLTNVVWFKSHTEAIVIEVVNGNQTSECSYTLSINGQVVKSGVLGPGEAVVINQLEHWHGSKSIHVEISNGFLTLKERTYGEEPLRFILYPDHIEEIGTA
jgi:archaellum component FlaG (FlaF/FlaG flagellin family)